MPDKCTIKTDTGSSGLVNDLRKFRFQKKADNKSIMSDDDDSNLTVPEFQTRRKIVNRIEDSDSDVDDSSRPKDADSDGDETKDRENKLKYLVNQFADVDAVRVQDALSKADWNTEEAEVSLRNNRKRTLKASAKTSNKKRRKTNRDEEADVDSDEGRYKEKVYDSNSDSDVEVSDELTPERKGVLEFMQSALLMELLLVSHCSQKRATAIINARPFGGWRDLVYKFQNNKYLGTELLNSAQLLLSTRHVVEALMKKCLKLSANMEKAVAAGASMISHQPGGISAGLKLAPYQMVGLNWLAVMHSQKVNGILADEMGLGKTIQVIAFLTYLKEAGLTHENDGPHLIVVPSSTMKNWRNELARWSPGLKVVQYYGSQDERKDMRMSWRAGDLDNVDVILTTYNLVGSTPEERRLFRVMPIEYVVFDEAHMLKNMSTIRYKNLIRINAKHRLLLTGTPLQNNLLELMSLLIFVMPSVFAGKQADLKSLFAKNSKIQASDKKNQPLFEQEQVKNAKQIMRPFILRRLKSEVLAELPKKSEKVIKCSLLKKQREMYKNLVAEFTEEADRNTEVNGIGMMMQLRKLANHPLLIRNYYDEDKLEIISKKLAKDHTYKQNNPQYIFENLIWMSDYQINQLSRVHKTLAGQGLPQELIPKSGKLNKLDELLPTMKEEGHRVLIFSQFTMVLDILEEYMAIRGHKFLRLDGQTPVTDRQNLIDEYTNDSSIFIFLLSTRAGGLGINLTASDTVIIHDIDFNPYNDKQAEDRCHRVGQKNPVTIIRLLGEDTIEEGMYEIAQEKLNLEQKITGNEENENTDKRSISKLLKVILGIDSHNRSLSQSPVKAANGSANGLKVDDTDF